jgi:2-succinyl-5-enolpyruvyl-6-hydroxy-3-cyclohexene-1-carboxylate synthase
VVDSLLSRGITASVTPRRKPSGVSVDAIARDCSSAERGIIVCGPAPCTPDAGSSWVARLAACTGFPVYAEATSQVRFGTGDVEPSLAVDGLGLLLGAPAFRDRFAPDLVLQIGDPPVSGAWDRFVGGHSNLVRHVVAPYGWPDPHGTARSVVVADVDETLSALIDLLGRGTAPPSTPWRTYLARANDVAWRVVESVLAEDTLLSEGAAVRAAVHALPGGALLSVGNSLPVRHVDAFVRQGKRGLSVLSQRGASGIDGVVSAAAGAATVTGRPTALLVGDVSALHDLGGFAAASLVDVPLVVVVLNNDGGRIFEQLPLSSLDIGEERLKFWTTPHGGHFGGLADLFPLRYEKPTTAELLKNSVAEATARPGCTVLEVTVPAHGVRERSTEISARLGRELAAVGAE